VSVAARQDQIEDKGGQATRNEPRAEETRGPLRRLNKDFRPKFHSKAKPYRDRKDDQAPPVGVYATMKDRDPRGEDHREHDKSPTTDLPPGTVPLVKLVCQPAAGPVLDPGEQAVEATSVQGGWPEARVAGSPVSCTTGGGQCGDKKVLALNSTPEPKMFGGLFGECQIDRGSAFPLTRCHHCS